MTLLYRLITGRVITRRLIFAFMLMGSNLFAQAPSNGTILEEVRARGELRCGVHLTRTPGFSEPVRGDFRGFEVDFCRAIAAVVLGDANKVDFAPLSASRRLTALELGSIDVLIRTTSWTSGRDSRFAYGPIIFFDEQSFMVPANSSVRSLNDMAGQRICVTRGTTSQESLQLIEQTQQLNLSIVESSDHDQSQERYSNGECDVWTADRTLLIARRSTLASPEAHRFVDLDVVFSKEPLAPVMQQGDNQWFDIVRWTIYATILAEELGITSSNVNELARSSGDANIRRLLGSDNNDELVASFDALGLEPIAFRRMIRAVGNYGEIYERHLGSQGIARGYNNLYSQGGLLYSPPFR